MRRGGQRLVHGRIPLQSFYDPAAQHAAAAAAAAAALRELVRSPPAQPPLEHRLFARAGGQRSALLEGVAQAQRGEHTRAAEQVPRHHAPRTHVQQPSKRRERPGLHHHLPRHQQGQRQRQRSRRSSCLLALPARAGAAEGAIERGSAGLVGGRQVGRQRRKVATAEHGQRVLHNV